MKTVLIVDDEAEIVELLSMVLEGDGVTLLAAYNGEEALAVVREEHPHLVLTDVMMPRLDGREVCRRLREDPATSDIVVILMTAARGLDLSTCDAHHVINKPFEIDSVAGTVQDYLAGVP